MLRWSTMSEPEATSNQRPEIVARDTMAINVGQALNQDETDHAEACEGG